MKTLIRRRLLQLFALTIIISSILYVISWGCIELKYARAVDMYTNHNYEESLQLFSELGQYKESASYKEELVAFFQEPQEDAIIIDDLKDNNNTWEGETPIYLVATNESAGMFDLESLQSDEVNTAPIYSVNETFATDAMNGKGYVVSDIADKEIVLFYEEDGFNVFFLGKINQVGQWDGSCLVNVYREGVLQNATLATYINGERDDYEQIFFEDEICVYTKRICLNDGNHGDTWEYRSMTNIEQIISRDAPDVKDFFYPSEVKENISTCLIKRYHGMTNQGYFEDSSGDAYLISYYDDGTIKTFYSGGFRLGKYDDESGRAWYITSDKYNDVGYMYFAGKFKSGSPYHDGSAEIFVKDITMSDVSEVVISSSYKGILNWDLEYMAKE